MTAQKLGTGTGSPVTIDTAPDDGIVSWLTLKWHRMRVPAFFRPEVPFTVETEITTRFLRFPGNTEVLSCKYSRVDFFTPLRKCVLHNLGSIVSQDFSLLKGLLYSTLLGAWVGRRERERERKWMNEYVYESDRMDD